MNVMYKIYVVPSRIGHKATLPPTATKSPPPKTLTVTLEQFEKESYKVLP